MYKIHTKKYITSCKKILTTSKKAYMSTRIVSDHIIIIKALHIIITLSSLVS